MKHTISKVFVLYESRKKRMIVGILEKEKNKYKFQYYANYLCYKMAIPLGPNLPLHTKPLYSTNLFQEFTDRIPSKQNPAYKDYCDEMDISETENDPFVLLTTIGSRGPSSFIFRTIPEEKFTGQDLKKFRKELQLTIHDFATLIDSEPATISRTEQGKLESKLLLKYCECLKNFPQELDNLLRKRGMLIHSEKLLYLQEWIWQKME